MRHIVIAIVLLSIPGWCATTQCMSTFKSSNFVFALEWCVTQNGNISYLGWPNGANAQLQGNEGYMIQGSNSVCYADNGVSDTGNWQTSIVNEPHGPNTFPLTITRTTADGAYTLTQSFAWASHKSGVVITMSIRGPGALWRYGDVVYGGSGQLLDYTEQSVFIWNPTQIQNRLGLMALSMTTNSETANSDPDAVGGVTNLCGGFNQTRNQFPYQGDSALALGWNLGSGKHSATAAMEYLFMN